MVSGCGDGQPVAESASTASAAESASALSRAVAAANQRYGSDWDCVAVSASPQVISCTQPSTDSFAADDEFRIVEGRALYWNGVRTAPASRFVPFVRDELRGSHGHRRVRCAVIRASLPYKIRCRVGGKQVISTVDLFGRINGTHGFGLGLP